MRNKISKIIYGCDFNELPTTHQIYILKLEVELSIVIEFHMFHNDGKVVLDTLEEIFVYNFKDFINIFDSEKYNSVRDLMLDWVEEEMAKCTA